MNVYKRAIKVGDKNVITLDFENYHNCAIVSDDVDLLKRIDFPRMIINKDNQEDLFVLKEIKEARYLDKDMSKYKFLIALIDISGMKSDSILRTRALLASTWGAGISILLFSDHKTWEKNKDMHPLVHCITLIDKEGEINEEKY